MAVTHLHKKRLALLQGQNKAQFDRNKKSLGKPLLQKCDLSIHLVEAGNC